MDERVKSIVADDARAIKAVTTDAVRSRAWLYPLKGVFYFISHKDLWKPLLSQLTPTLSTGVIVTLACFAALYLPQAAIMAFTSGPVAAFSAALLTLSESSTITNAISRAFFIEEALVDTFDGTLLSRDCTNLVEEGRQVKSGGGDNIARLGKLVKKPFAKFAPNAILRYLLYLPLNFIPVVGTVLFVVLQGKRGGPQAHARYFQLKEWNKGQKERFVKDNRGGYTAFGVAAFMLEMVPFANLIFAFTNTVGAALWAADLEKSAGTAPRLREQAKKAQ